jgi:hypothetical protein
MPIALDAHAADIDARCRQVLVAERVLNVGERSRLIGDQARKAVPRLVEVHGADPGGHGVALQVVGEGVAGERVLCLSRQTGDIAAGPLRESAASVARRPPSPDYSRGGR